MSNAPRCHWDGCKAVATHWGQYCAEHAAEFTGGLEYEARNTEGNLW